MAKIFEPRDKVAVVNLIKIVSAASHTLKGAEIKAVNQTFDWLESLAAKINSYAGVELFQRGEFEVQITKVPDESVSEELSKPAEE